MQPLISLDHAIHHSIQMGFPSAELLVAKNNEIIKHQHYGKGLLHQFYDIASLTKIFSITYLAMYLHSRGKLDLEETLSDIFGKDIKSPYSAISIQMLLSHTAGYAPNPLYYDPSYHEALYCQSREKFLSVLLQTPIVHPQNANPIYSDVDFMLLTFILEHKLGMNLSEALEHYFLMPLNLKSCYTPLKKGIAKEQIAPTEKHGNTRDHTVHFPNIREYELRGEVQDEKAYHCMGEISGHAGLFSNTMELFTLISLMTMPNDFFTEKTKQCFLHRNPIDPTFGLGFRLNGNGMNYHFGEYASKNAFGHTGWTGCMFMVDPKDHLTIIYLTNRKNTPILNPQHHPNQFYGDLLWAGKYRNIVNSIYRQLECM